MTKEAEEKKRGPLRNLSNLPRTEMQLRRDAELPEVGKNGCLFRGCTNPHSVGVRLLVPWAGC